MLLLAHCKQSYDPQIESKNIRLLVVEGFINSGQGPTVIRLSRTGDLKDTAIRPVLGAQVYIEGENGSSFMLSGNTIGEYSTPQLQLGNNTRYRVHIKTTDGKEYTSEYSSVKFTPPVDSVTWQREDNGLRLYANAHDPQNATKYYQWRFEETWEFHSTYFTSLKYLRDSRDMIIGVEYRNPDRSEDTNIYKCWNTLNSSSILLGSTEKLTTDLVYLPVHYIEPGSEKLSVLYSLNLHQYAISHEEYLFLQKMKRNTEQVGSIFDAQPSQLSGNIHCLSDPDEIVIGYVEVAQEQTKRIFIYNNQVPGWNYDAGCERIEIPNNSAAIDSLGVDRYPTTVAILSPLGTITSFYAANKIQCIDCTTRGVHIKPDFWP